MIPYAGYDPTEGREGYYPSPQAIRDGDMRQRAYVMFRAGRDTLEIAQALGVEEHRVHAWISRERSDHLGLPNPYAGSAQ